MSVRTRTATLTATERAVLGLLTQGAAYGADIQGVRALPARPSALTGRVA
jgi:hypothetical protein